MAWPKRNLTAIRRASPASGGITDLAAVFGSLLSLVLLLVVAGVAVVFAAAFAVVLALGMVMTALSAAAWRVRPRPALARVGAGHAWVQYGPGRTR